MEHRLDLLGNSIDSLNQGLRSYAEGQNGDPHAYKFAVLHVSHFLELLFKHAVAKQHPLLIYRKPHSRTLATEPTIGLWEALGILRNSGQVFDDHFLADLTWLKALRNDIEHYQFTMDADTVRATIGRLISAAHELADSTSGTALTALIAETHRATYRSLFESYQTRVALAKEAVLYDLNEDDTRRADCHWCGENEVAVETDSSVVCKLCLQVDNKSVCVSCGRVFRDSAVAGWFDDDVEGAGTRCAACESSRFGDE